jgi:hypothetical protein
MFSFSAGLIDSTRPAERREEMNEAKPIELSCDVQRIVLMKNSVHALTLAQAEESN